ncbi:MAG: gamma-glutamyltransferase, partial [Planctomycetes bacterium]|nr:gamma-glutamyltransferase [Planctomycetota bacterium]
MSGGMVATSQPLATEAGLAIFREGGNAADAMVAACAVLAVVEPTSTGLGGDGWALHYEAATRRVTSLNGTGRSPAALTSARLEAEGIVGRSVPPRHAHAVTVPGCVAALCDLAARHGSFPLRRLLAPAIRFAEEGFPVTPVTAAFWARSEALLGGAPGGGMFLPGGRAPRAGERFRNPDLARILRRIAEGGADAFYRGEVACAVACAVREAGGCLDEADLAGHVSTWDEPLSAPYRGVRVWECPPNGQGIAALLALRIAEGFDLASLDPLGSARLHLLIESMRLAFTEARAVVADPAHIPVPAASLLEEARVRALRARIDPACALPDPQGPPPGHGTVYLCAVDGAGNAVSIACSNYQGFGTGIVPAGCGFTLQNRGAGFSLDPASPNVLAPRKRSFHTVMPGM